MRLSKLIRQKTTAKKANLALRNGDIEAFGKLLQVLDHKKYLRRFGHPIRVAVTQDNPAFFELIVTVFTENYNTEAILKLAGYSNSRAITPLLLDRVPKDWLRSKANDLIHDAAQGNLPLAAALIDHGADVNLQAEDKMAPIMYTGAHATPLMFAATTGKKDIVAMLLAQGADPNLHNKIGMRASDFARCNRENPSAEIEQLLLKSESWPVKAHTNLIKKVLPKETFDFLQAKGGIQIDCNYDAGIVTLALPHQVRVGKFTAIAHDRSFDLICFDLNFHNNDYFFPGLLVYIPSMGRFGTVDREHDEITVFMTDWPEIENALPEFLNGQWESDHPKIKPLEDVFKARDIGKYAKYQLPTRQGK